MSQLVRDSPWLSLRLALGLLASLNLEHRIVVSSPVCRVPGFFAAVLLPNTSVSGRPGRALRGSRRRTALVVALSLMAALAGTQPNANAAGVTAVGSKTPPPGAAKERKDPYGPERRDDRHAADVPTATALAKQSGRRVGVDSAKAERSTLFALPDGGFERVVHALPRRVPASGGGWQDVDTSLQPAGGRLRAVANKGGVSLSAGGDRRLVQEREPAGVVALDWPGTLPAPNVTADTAVYPGVSPGIDAVVRALPDGYETSFVVNSRPATAPVFRLPLSLPARWVASSTAGGGVQVAEPMVRYAGCCHRRSRSMPPWRRGRAIRSACRSR